MRTRLLAYCFLRASLPAHQVEAGDLGLSEHGGEGADPLGADAVEGEIERADSAADQTLRERRPALHGTLGLGLVGCRAGLTPLTLTLTREVRCVGKVSR